MHFEALQPPWSLGDVLGGAGRRDSVCGALVPMSRRMTNHAANSSSALNVVCPSCNKPGVVTVDHSGAIVSQYVWAVACSFCKKTFTVSLKVGALEQTN